jgi:hypothetical protein
VDSDQIVDAVDLNAVQEVADMDSVALHDGEMAGSHLRPGQSRGTASDASFETSALLSSVQIASISGATSCCGSQVVAAVRSFPSRSLSITAFTGFPGQIPGRRGY